MKYVCYGLIAHEAERVDPGYRTTLSVQSSLVMLPIHAYADEAQHEKYLPKLAEGKWIDSFRLTEPDPGDMESHARKAGGGYVLEGCKRWIGNASIAHILVVRSKDDAGTARGFILKKRIEGLSIRKIEGKLSLRTS